MKFVLVLSLAALMAACANQGDDRLKEVSKIESEADQEVQKARAQELETDLAQRQRFYKALSGEFVGVVTTGTGTFSVRMNLVPKVPTYKPTRTRTVEEVTNDLVNLGFIIQVTQWVPGNDSTGVPCVVDDVKPNLEEGVIYALDGQCSSFFTLFPSLEGVITTSSTPQDNGKAVTLGVLSGEVPQVNKLIALSKPSANPNTYKFELKRVK